MKVEQRIFEHYGQTFHSFVNVTKLEKLKQYSESTLRLADFITDVILDDRIPHEYFTEDKPRCSSLKPLKCVVTERPSRYRNIILKALQNRGNREKHYVVLKALVENPETNIVICEMPVWSINGQMLGHIDCIELTQGNPSIWIWDYKPYSDIDPSGQICMYQILLSQLIQVPIFQIGIGWFNEIEEVVIVDWKA